MPRVRILKDTTIKGVAIKAGPDPVMVDKEVADHLIAIEFAERVDSSAKSESDAKPKKGDKEKD
jgi:hypothetical protein